MRRTFSAIFVALSLVTAFAALGTQNSATTQGLQSQVDSLQAQIATA